MLGRSRWLPLLVTAACSGPSEAPPLEPSSARSAEPSLSTSAAPSPSARESAQLAAPPAKAASPTTFEVHGAKLKAELTFDAPTVMVGEPSYATLRVTHVSGPPVLLYASWMGRNQFGRPENYELTFLDGQGAPVAYPPVTMAFGGQSWLAEVKPDQAFKARLFLPAWTLFKASGRHTVRLTTTWPVHRAKDDVPTDVKVSVEAAIDVVPADAAKLGALIDGWAAKATSEDEAFTKLLAIEDPRVVPHFVALATSKSYTHRMQATRALGEWNEDGALAALVAASKTRGADLDPAQYTSDALREQSADLVRVTAAQTLAASPHPKALEALLAMKSDPYASVRLTVLQKAATLDPKIGGPIVKAMLADKDALVRQEAQRLSAKK